MPFAPDFVIALKTFFLLVMIRLVALSLLCLSGSAFCQTAAEPETPDTWVVRTFQLPPDFLMPSVGDEFSKGIDQSTPASEVVEQIKRTSAFYSNTSETLTHKGNPVLPKGSAGLYDKRSGTYVFRTTAEKMELLEAFVDSCHDQVPDNLVHTLHLIQADGAILRQAAKEASGLYYHNDLWSRLEGLTQQGQVKHLDSLRLESRSGDKAKFESDSLIEQTTDFTLESNGQVSWNAPVMPIASRTSLQVDAVLGPDGLTVDKDFIFEYHFANPTHRNELITHTVAMAPLVIPVSDFYRFKTNMTMTCQSGNTKLIGLWKPQGTPELEGKDIMQAAFLHTAVVKLFSSAPNRDLEKIFLAHVDKVVPLPEEPPAKSKPPKGMSTRFYTVPVDFLSLGLPPLESPTAAPDPFAPSNRDPFRTSNAPSAVEILKAQGIAFPQGSTAHFRKSARRLTVTNTLPNLDMVEAFIDSIRERQPLTVALTLHIFQAEGAIIRQIARENADSADQAGSQLVLEKLVAEGKAKSVNVLRVETRSGQRTTTEVGTLKTILSDIKCDEHGKQTFHHAFQPAGTVFAADAVLRPDGYTMDVSLVLEHHFAPTTLKSDDAAKARSIVSPTMDFHFANVTTSVTMFSGMTKLIGLWKPAGSVEFEGKDLMQAAFLTATIVQPMTDKKP